MLAARRADTGDYSVVVVLRPLTASNGHVCQKGPADGGAFFAERYCYPHAARAFSLIFRYDQRGTDHRE